MRKHLFSPSLFFTQHHHHLSLSSISCAQAIIHTPLIATARRRPPPPAPCGGFFFPWIFASHHADGPWAKPDGSVFPPPPSAALLFHSKMASALEPLVSGCIFRLVVVSVPHGSGTFCSAARREIPVSSSERGKRRGLVICFYAVRFSRASLGNRTGPARAFWATARG